MASGAVPPHHWRSAADPEMSNIGKISTLKRVVIVLPKAFGVNGWVLSVADRLAAAGALVLKMQLLQERHQGSICPIRTRIWIWKSTEPTTA
jgi:dienelactone hydrolase